MPKASKSSVAGSPASAEKQLETFIRKFKPEHQRLIHTLRRALRRRFPTANELVYDNYNFFVIGYSPSERPSEYIVSLAAGASGVGLSFNHGAQLPDPQKLLQGSGAQNRFIRLPSAAILAKPEIQKLLDAAVAHEKTTLPRSGRGRLIIRSISKKQRPRRKPEK